MKKRNSLARAISSVLLATSIAMSSSLWAAAPNLEPVGQLSLTNNLAVAIQGNYAYTGDGASLKILDVSNPANPIIVGTSAPMPDSALMDIVVQGKYAYVANARGGLRIFDVSSPKNPVEVGVYNTNQPNDPMDWTLWGVAVRDGYAYVADMGSGLRILDVSDPTKPTEVSFIGSQGLTHAVRLKGNFAYMVDWSGGLRIVDIIDPKNPKEVGFLATKSLTYDVDFSSDGKIAYIADYDGLRIVDISNPQNPQEISFFDTPDINTVVVASGDYLYTNSGGELKVLDVSNSQSPQEVTSYNAPNNGSGYGLSHFKLNSGLLYVPNRDGGLIVLSNGLSNTACTEWNLAKDFRMSPNQENPNRDSCGNTGVWHFLQSGDMNRDPQTYTLMPNFSTNSLYNGAPGVHNWTGTEIPDVTVFKNEKDSFQSNYTYLSNSVYMHTGWSHLTVVGWRSPVDSNVKISGELASIYINGQGCGDGIKWYVDKGATNLVSGAFPNGSSQDFQKGTITVGSSLSNISVKQGEFIYFIVDRNADAFCDATKLDVTISQVTTANPLLQVIKIGDGAVFSTMSPFSCSTSACTGSFAPNTLTVLTAMPATGSTFSGWTGCDSTNGNECTVMITADKTVTATFNSSSSVSLSCFDNPTPATFNIATRIVSIPAMDAPLLDIITGLPSGGFGVFSAQLQLLAGVEDFKVNRLDFISFSSAYNTSHGRYDYQESWASTGGKLSLCVAVPQVIGIANAQIPTASQRFDVVLRQLAIDSDIFHIESMVKATK